ncbi:hypothetical protein R1sor_021409 [Riccia sorocarpa]|uniref:Uncharacterized protein n=1 Tax=Riccia sorocarpa TaxID=122646 RepID=A0ABD3GH11_9MARC
MEGEVEGRIKPLPYKVRTVSRESASQKAAHVLDPDPRTHWSTSTNTKEWLVLELEESCLLSHIRIHNKSVLEWEVSIGLRFKPDTYLKVRPRCEAPRREITYHIGYQPCCFVRISCLRGNPIAIFSIQLMGIPVPGLEPEFQPVVDHVLPHIIAHIRDPFDIYLQLLQDIASRLSAFLPHLEGELAVGSEAMETSLRFFALLVGPFYPILTLVGGRESEKAASSGTETDIAKSKQPTVLTVSSNFQAPPKRVRSPGLTQHPSGHALALRPDAVLVLLRVGHKDTDLGNVGRKVARILRRLNGSSSSAANSLSVGESAVSAGGSSVPGFEEGFGSSEAAVTLSSAVTVSSSPSDYSSIFGEAFKPYDDDGPDISHFGILDVAAVEEGLLHVLYACASQPVMCRRLADSKSDLISVLPFTQAMLPALRPLPSTGAADADQVDETFWQWQAPAVQRAVSQVVALSTSPSYRPLLDACAGYLSSYSPIHEKTACVLIDLCAGPLGPWLPMVVAKIDLAVELLEDLLGVIQAGHQDTCKAGAALVYLMLALSGNVDDILGLYKEVKHHILFLIEMLEPYLIPAINPVKSTIAFGDVSAVLLEKQEQYCALALDLLHSAVNKPAVLPAMEAEWRRGHVTPSVLLSILAPDVPLPPGLDLGRSSGESLVHDSSLTEDSSATHGTEVVTKFSTTDDEGTSKGEYAGDGTSKADVSEDPNHLFAPPELRSLTLPSVASRFHDTSPDSQKVVSFGSKVEEGKVSNVKTPTAESKLVLDAATADRYFSLQAEYFQLVNSQERELRAMEFIRFATELHSRRDASKEGQQAAIDALLLAAECHLNPFFLVPPTTYQQQVVRFRELKGSPFSTEGNNTKEGTIKTGKNNPDLEVVYWLEEERDKAVLRILLEAAEWDSSSSLEETPPEGSPYFSYQSGFSCGVHIFKEDAEAEDAVTLVREHQVLLCSFLIRQLRRERHSMYEVLLQGLLIILDSATKLSSPPSDIIEVILNCAERLNNSLVLYYSQVKDGAVVTESAVVYGIQRQWALLQRLVLAASGGRSSEEEGGDMEALTSSIQTALIPAWAWMAKISEFASSSFPLVRYVGWMALSRYAKLYKETGLLLVADVQELTSLLIVFSDELSSVSGWKLRKPTEEDVMVEAAYRVATGSELNYSLPGPNGADRGGLVKALYPELDLVFPQLRTEFSRFADAMLDSVCRMLRTVPSSTIPDLLSWFSELCLEPFPASVKGYALANVKYVVVNLLEVIVVEHTEAVVPELPRILEVLLSLCSSSYCDVPLLESVLAVLKPIITHATSSVDNSQSFGQHAATFESLCFDAMTEQLKVGADGKERGSGGGLLLYLAGSLLSDLSIRRRIELISSFTGWVNFTARSSTMSYHTYLLAFQEILEESSLLLRNLVEETNSPTTDEKQQPDQKSVSGLIALSLSQPSLAHIRTSSGLEAGVEGEKSEAGENGATSENGVLSLHAENHDMDAAIVGDSEENENMPEDDEQGSVEDDGIPSQDLITKSNFSGSSAEIKEFQQKCSELTLALGSALEVCWRIHPHLCQKVAQLAAKSLFYASSQAYDYNSSAGEKSTGDSLVETSSEPLEALVQKVKKFQEAHNWQVAAVTMDFLLSLPSRGPFTAGALKEVCSVLQYQCTHAPRVAWRLQTSRWLVKALSLAGGDSLLNSSEALAPLTELLCAMLEHTEPEQRLGALQQLGNLIKSHLDDTSGQDGVMLKRHSQDTVVQKGFTHALVASTWEKVTSTAACDPSLALRKEALELLLKFIPFADPPALLSLLRSSDAILPPMTTSAATVNSGPLTRLALMVLSRTCLYVSASDVSIIPAKVWSSIELMANAKAGGLFADGERLMCQALLDFRENGDAAKQPMRELLLGKGRKSSSSSNLSPVREAVLEVLARLSAVRRKEESNAAAAEELAKEVEEAEMELELLSKEKSPHRADGSESLQERVTSSMSASVSGISSDPKERLKQLKAQIMAEDHAKTYAAIAARREKQRIARRNRQLFLEKAALRENDLLQELDRERAAEAEREIERQRILEKERAKTREMRHNVDIEAERRTQRELQRELEQRESGTLRQSRREFASATTPSSRPRERYRERERESGRSGQDGGTTPRPNTAGSGGGPPLREAGTTPPATPTAGGGSNRSSYSSGVFAPGGRDDRGGYDDSAVEGNGSGRGGGEISGDGGANFGDGEGGGSGLEAGSGGNLGVGHRQSGQRTNRPTRPIVERRERDGRREGKWERKQT